MQVSTVSRALCCSFLWACVTVASKMLVLVLPTGMFSLLRYGLGALCLIPFVALKTEKEPLKVKYFGVLLFLGFSLVIVFSGLFFNALYYSSPTTVSLIMTTNPILTLLTTAVLYKQTPNKYQLASFVLAFAGASLVITEGKVGMSLLQGTVGEFLAMGAVISQIMYAFMLKKVSAHYSAEFITFVTFLSGSVLITPLVLNSESLISVLQLNQSQWWLIFLVSSLGTALASYLYSLAIHTMGPTQANLIIFSTLPVFVMILSFTILGETISLYQIVGGLLVISSLMLGLSHTR